MPDSASPDSTLRLSAEPTDAAHLVEQFATAWRAGEAPRLEEFVARSDHASRSDLFAQLLGVELELRRQSGQSLEPDEYVRRFPQLSAVVASVFARSTGASHHDTATYDPGESGTTQLGSGSPAAPVRRAALHGKFGPYELLAEIARGGMGVVYRARDERLQRVVALKMILDGPLADEDEILRFRKEAEAAAKLDHPGIVPVYEVGQIEGQHYLAMGFVEGQSLARRIAERPLPPREAAQLAQTIAEAVAYAHSRGVVHRDLKPANVLLDQSSQPRVTDFGLAKQLHEDSGLTATGQVMGTPAYMPPEQAQGRTNEVGIRSDVYSLGALLYHCLTGHPPFQAATLVETLRYVVDRDPIPPRRVNPAIDLDLQTICLKCLEKSLDRRYATATDLAADLGRYLRHEPIVARPPSPVGRFVRWCRRQPGTASLIALALTLLVAGVSGVFHQWRQAEAARGAAQRNFEQSEQRGEKLKSALDTIQAEKDRADEHLKTTEDVVYYFLTNVAEGGELTRTPGTLALRKRLLERARGHYESIVAQDQQDRTSRGLAQALWRLGLVQLQLGELAAAQTSLTRSIDEWDRLLRDNPEAEILQHGRAACLGNLGLVYDKLGKLDLAEREFQAAIDASRPLAERPEPHLDSLTTLATSTLNLAASQLRRGAVQDAVRTCESAIVRIERLIEFQPEARHTLTLATAHSNLGMFVARLGELDRALEEQREALALAQTLVERDGENPESLEALALTTHNLAQIHDGRGDGANAAAAYEKARQWYERLASENPRAFDYQVRLVDVVTNYSAMLRRRGDLKQAMELARRALDRATAIEQTDENKAHAQNSIAKLRNNLGIMCEDELKTAEALEHYQAAAQLREALLAGPNLDSQVAHDLVATYTNLGNIWRQLGKTAEARTVYRRSRELAEQLVAEHPGVAVYEADVGRTYSSLSQVDLDENLLDDAERNLSRAIQSARDLLKESPSNVDFQVSLGKRLNNMGVLQMRRNQVPEARATLGESSEIWRGLSRLDAAVPDYQVELIFNYANLSQMAAATLDLPEAKSRIGEAKKIAQGLVDKHPQTPFFQSLLKRIEQEEEKLQ